MSKNEKYIRRWNSPNAKARFVDLEEVFDLGGNFLCVVEEPYGIPSEESDNIPRIKNINYGHIVGLINSADRNEWDIIFPGHTCPLNMVVCDKIVGYVHDSKGNHKIIGRCYGAPTFSEQEFIKQLKSYVKKRREVYDDDAQAYMFGEIDDENYVEY